MLMQGEEGGGGQKTTELIQGQAGAETNASLLIIQLPYKTLSADPLYLSTFLYTLHRKAIRMENPEHHFPQVQKVTDHFFLLPNF